MDSESYETREKEQDRGMVDIMMIIHHFFKEFPAWISEMENPRHSSYITYQQSDLIYMGLVKNLCGVKTLHSMEEQFNKKNCIAALRVLSGNKNLDEMPHSDTLNYYLERLSPDCLLQLRKKLVKRLVRMKSFHRGSCWDSTGGSSWMERGCFILRKSTVETLCQQRLYKKTEQRQKCITIKCLR